MIFGFSGEVSDEDCGGGVGIRVFFAGIVAPFADGARRREVIFSFSL